MEKSKRISYSQAINDATSQAMKMSKDVIIMGQLIDYSSGVFGTTSGLINKFGEKRVKDFPAAESLMTQAGVGAALAGQRVLLVHIRIDFMIYSLDSIVNWLSMWRFKSNRESNVPVVIRAIVGRGWGQGPQHSQSLESIFAHIPGIKVVMPSSPYDAKGLFVSSVRDNNPVIYIDDRWLYEIEEEVPDDMYEVKIGTADIKKSGEDITIISNSYMTELALLASNRLSSIGVDAEIVDLRTIKPLDAPTIVNSVRKTGAILVLDGGWKSFGISSEIISIVVESSIAHLKFVPGRVTLPDAPAPTSKVLEECYYPTTEVIVQKVKSILEKKIERNYEV